MKDDADYLAALIIRIASANTTLADAEWLREFLLFWFREEGTPDSDFVSDEDVLVCALEDLKL